MALVIGTNAGFVTTAPTSDPSGASVAMDNWAKAQRDTSPLGNYRVTEIGWWCDNATQEANFEVGIYDDNSDTPGNVVGSLSKTNAKGTDSGWKVVSGLDITLQSSTVYWIAIQLDNTTTQTNANYSVLDLSRLDGIYGATTLQDPWAGSTSSLSDFVWGVYALVEEVSVSSEQPKGRQVLSQNKPGGALFR